MVEAPTPKEPPDRLLRQALEREIEAESTPTDAHPPSAEGPWATPADMAEAYFEHYDKPEVTTTAPNPYDTDAFWAEYQDFVDESISIHLRAVPSLLAPLNTPSFGTLLDLGCGRCEESRRLFEPDVHLGFDRIHGDDYRDLAQVFREVQRLLRPGEPQPNVFCSLFSTELTASPEDNQRYYEALFEAFPSLEFGIVAGFYYDDARRDQPEVQEGGLWSWQSIGPVLDSETITETRLLIRNPSKMFGPSVVEVWRRFDRTKP